MSEESPISLRIPRVMRLATGRRAEVAASVLAAAVLLGCAHRASEPKDPTGPAIQALRDEVARVVPDASRNAQLRVAIDSYEAELRSFRTVMLELQDSLQALNADPNASREQFTTLIAGYEGERKAILARLLQTHHELLNATTAEEWSPISKREIKVLRVAADLATLEHAQ